MVVANNNENEVQDEATLSQQEKEEEISAQLVLEHPTYRQLEEKLTQVEQQAQDNWNKWLRAQAELENLQRRTEREIANAHKYALEKFIPEVLVVVDNLERSLSVKDAEHEHLKDFYAGIELTLKLCLESLEKFGVTPINPIGAEFDPTQHTAVMTKEESSANPNAVVEVIQKGYWLKDRLLRPALVVVAK